MVVDGLEVFRLHRVPAEVVILAQAVGDFPHHVLDEQGIAVGFLGDELLILAFKQGIDLAGRRLLHQADQVFDPEEFLVADLDPHFAPLVVGARLADLLGAGA